MAVPAAGCPAVWAGASSGKGAGELGAKAHPARHGARLRKLCVEVKGALLAGGPVPLRLEGHVEALQGGGSPEVAWRPRTHSSPLHSQTLFLTAHELSAYVLAKGMDW